MPPWPIVIDIMAPNVDPGWDRFVVQDFLQRVGILQHAFFPGALAAAGDNSALTVLFQESWVIEVWQVRQGRIVIDFIVHEIADKNFQAKHSADGNHGVKTIWVAEEKIPRMVATHAAAGGNNLLAF